MRPPTTILLLSLVLTTLSSPIPQEGNEQIEKLNVSPSPTTPAPTAAALTNASEPSDPALQALTKPPKIDAEDGMKAGMGAAMSGIGQATQALSSLPVLGSLAGATGGLGGRDLEVVEKRSPLLGALSSLPILGALGGIKGGRKVRRQLYPKLDHLPDMGSNGVINLGQKVKRQFGSLTSLISSLGGGKAKRDPAFEALGELPAITGTVLKAVGKPNGKRQLNDLPTITKRKDPLSHAKKMVAFIANVRGITSKRDAAPDAAPAESDFRSGLREANKAKVDGELKKAEDKTERKNKIKNTKFPPWKCQDPK